MHVSELTIGSVNPLLPKPSVVLLVPIEVLTVLSDFSWGDMNRCPLTPDSQQLFLDHLLAWENSKGAKAQPLLLVASWNSSVLAMGH